MNKGILVATTALAFMGFLGAARAADCGITVGVVMEMTGPAGNYGQAGSKSVEMAFRDLNDAGGPGGCTLSADIRDSQSQASVAVDAATQLVGVKKVPLLIGGIISSTSIPILTSVTGPAKVVQISPAASSPTLTSLGKSGKTNGVFFRTIQSDALQGLAEAKFAMDHGYKRLSVIYVNGDFGVNLLNEFSKAYKALGGELVSVTPYNEKQSTYQAEVTAGMKGNPDALFLISTPVDGATIARTWISQGGVQKFLLNDGMESPDFVESVGAQYLNDTFGTSSGTIATASTDYFLKNYKAFSGLEPSSPPANRAYDAAAIAGLALAIAGPSDPEALRKAVSQVVDPKGTPIFAGKDEFVKALALIKDHKPIKYEGVVGPLSFDEYGDVTGPFQLWKFTDGKQTTVGEMTKEQVDQLKAQLH